MSDLDETPDSPEDDVRMSIWEHLEEFRKRLVRCAVALAIGAGCCWFYRVKLLALMLRPYERVWAERGLAGTPDLQVLSTPDALTGYMQLALTGGLVFAVPIIFYQLWSFISPGLYSKEKRLIYPFVFFASSLFLAGVAFAYFIVFPFMYQGFLSETGTVTALGTTLTMKPTMEYFVDFTTRMLLVFGFVFQLPMLITFLALAGIVTPRALLGFGRYAVVASCIVGAIATPGQDIGSMLALSGALMALYFLAVGVSFVLVREKPRAADEIA
jgi:sec-independent protein translocase protein TatC